MSDDESEPVMSPLCQSVSSGGKLLQIEIYGDGEGKWILEIVDEFNNSTVWDNLFESDSAALAEAKKSILKETAATFVGPKDGKSSEEWR